jgi:hypothetical protein
LIAREHLVVRLKIRAGVGDEFAFGEPVERFDAGNLGTHVRRMSCDVFDELVLCISRPGHKHGTRIGNSARHLLKELMVFPGMTATNAIGLVVNMVRRIMRVEHKLINLSNVEMKNSGFEVIDPDDRMIVA